MSKSHNESQQWKSKFESGGGVGSAGAEEAKKKLAIKLAEAEEQLDSALNKYAGLEKHKIRLQTELEEMSDNFEKANSDALNFEKKLRQLERNLAESKSKGEDGHRGAEQAHRDLQVSFKTLKLIV